MNMFGSTSLENFLGILETGGSHAWDIALERIFMLFA
jgi:hypothetical protein